MALWRHIQTHTVRFGVRELRTRFSWTGTVKLVPLEQMTLHHWLFKVSRLTGGSSSPIFLLYKLNESNVDLVRHDHTQGSWEFLCQLNPLRRRISESASNVNGTLSAWVEPEVVHDQMATCDKMVWEHVVDVHWPWMKKTVEFESDTEVVSELCRVVFC